MKLFDISATIESAVRGLSRFDLDFLTVHGDPHVVRAAREGGMAATGLAGRDGGAMVDLCDPLLTVPSRSTARIQEMHIMLGHILIDCLEAELDVG